MGNVTRLAPKKTAENCETGSDGWISDDSAWLPDISARTPKWPWRIPGQHVRQGKQADKS